MDPANEALCESWVLSLHTKRRNTVTSYLRDVRGFAAWWKGDLLEVTKQDVERWIAHERDRGMAAATIRARWIALRSFYAWATDENEIPVNPVAKVTVGKGSPKAPKVLSPAELERLLKACEGTGFYERRDMAMIRLFVATGLRRAEMAALELADLDLPNRLAVVRDGKGGRARVVRFDAPTAAALDRYKRVRARHRCAAEAALWVGHRGCVTKKGIPGIIAKRGLDAKIGHIHPHMLRHVWADRWLAAGGTEGDLMLLGGWQSADIMRRYGASRAADRALGAYDQIDPMKGL